MTYPSESGKLPEAGQSLNFNFLFEILTILMGKIKIKVSNESR